MTRKLGEPRPVRVWPGSLAAATLALAVAASPAAAQTDYSNTDRRRPVQIEDAYPTKHRSLEVKVAPLLLQFEEGDEFNWMLTPELTYGILPRTHVSIAYPFGMNDVSDGNIGDTSPAGIDISVLHNLKLESRSLPAFGVRADLWIPSGGLSPEKVHPALTGLMTHSIRGARLNVNAQYTFVDEDDENASELSRWLLGLAVDRKYARRSLLLTADVFVNEPLGEGVQFNAEAGIRHQVNSRLALDAALGGTLAGEDDSNVFITFGGAYSLLKFDR